MGSQSTNGYCREEIRCTILLHHFITPCTARINVAQAIRFSSTTRSCNTPPLASPSRYSTSRRQDCITINLALLRGLTQQLSTTSLVSLQNLLQRPPLSLEQNYAPPPLRPQQRRPVYDTLQHRLATQHRRPIPPPPAITCVSSARLSHHQKLHLSTKPLQHSPLPASSERALPHRPPSVAALSDTTLLSTPDSRRPRSPLLSVKHNW